MNTATQNRAQKTFMLPRDLRPDKKFFESVGFLFEDVGDDVLYQVTLPEGWKLEPSNNFWNDLVDEKGRKRGASFYKDFLGRIGWMHLSLRFYPTSEYDNPQDPESTVNVLVKDFDGSTIFFAGKCDEFYNQKFEELMEKTTQFLESNYPEWKSPDKYWD